MDCKMPATVLSSQWKTVLSSQNWDSSQITSVLRVDCGLYFFAFGEFCRFTWMYKVYRRFLHIKSSQGWNGNLRMLWLKDIFSWGIKPVGFAIWFLKRRKVDDENGKCLFQFPFKTQLQFLRILWFWIARPPLMVTHVARGEGSQWKSGRILPSGLRPPPQHIIFLLDQWLRRFDGKTLCKVLHHLWA